MRAIGFRLVVLASVLLSVLLVGGPARGAATPGDCNNDSKQLGPVLLSTEDAPGTWWRLSKEGFEAAGFTGEAGYIEAIEMIFGTTFGSLEEAVQTMVDAVVGLDRNGNGYVCAAVVRGERAAIPFPDWELYFFGVQDDKHVKG